MPHPSIDLRSDIIAPATPEMLEAMASATVGVAMWSEDASVAALEAAGAEMLGTEACLFVPNATSGNLLALLAQVERGSAVLADAASHINEVEWYGMTALGGAMPRTLPSHGGHLEPDEVEAALKEGTGGRAARVALLVLENTHTFAGGVVLTPDETATLAVMAHHHGAAVHVDGARLFNAAVALNVPARDLTRGLDTVTVSLSKGLCAPGGALLAGRRDTIGHAREIGLHIGTLRTHKSGYFAAAGLIALRTMVDRLADDHRRARVLGEALAAIEGVAVPLDTVQTNLVMAYLAPRYGDSREVAARLEARGLRMLAYSGGRLRAVTHRGIDDGAIASAIGILTQELG